MSPGWWRMPDGRPSGFSNRAVSFARRLLRRGPLMASPPTTDPPLPPVKLDPLAALLSYLVPGLGQIYQGRVGKGLLFFGGLYLLFFYGMWMGQWRNVWLPDADPLPPVAIGGQELGGFAKAVYHRPQFLGQFWIGVAAWP